jgi:hypothetical protein
MHLPVQNEDREKTEGTRGLKYLKEKITRVERTGTRKSRMNEIRMESFRAASPTQHYCIKTEVYGAFTAASWLLP